MRKFQYVVTVDLDDEYLLSPEVKAELEKLDGIEGPDPVYALAEAQFPNAMARELARSMGESGNTTIQVLFAGEEK